MPSGETIVKLIQWERVNPMHSNGPKISVVVPLFNTADFIAMALDSIQSQTYTDFEVIVVDDGSTDTGPAVVQQYVVNDPRFNLVSQVNRGLAGARNTGIAAARGNYVAFLDADDAWHPEKLAEHVQHLESNPAVGVSYAGSDFIDQTGKLIGQSQNPKLTNVSSADIFCRNPIGNGSAPVIRRSILDEVEFCVNSCGQLRRCWFDESFRQSEDIELWTRISVSTCCIFEGLDRKLTLYRVNSAGLSADTRRQLESWLRFRTKLAGIAPALVKQFGVRAEAYQLRYLARRAAVSGDGTRAVKNIAQAMLLHPRLLSEEPVRTLQTVALSFAALGLPTAAFMLLKTTVLGGRQGSAAGAK
jgi:glycosyltransferase involved in cell wall biosynthesis